MFYTYFPKEMSIPWFYTPLDVLQQNTQETNGRWRKYQIWWPCQSYQKNSVCHQWPFWRWWGLRGICTWVPIDLRSWRSENKQLSFCFKDGLFGRKQFLFQPKRCLQCMTDVDGWLRYALRFSLLVNSDLSKTNKVDWSRVVQNLSIPLVCI